MKMSIFLDDLPKVHTGEELVTLLLSIFLFTSEEELEMLVNIFQDIDREDLERGINLMKLSSVEGLPKCIRVSVSSMSYLLFTIALLELCYHGLFYIGGKRVKSM